MRTIIGGLILVVETCILGFIGHGLQFPIKNMVGDGKLHRWRRKNLKELLEDYEFVMEMQYEGNAKEA